MERKLGEVFEFEGKKLKAVKSSNGSCKKCYFNNRLTACGKISENFKNCSEQYREDSKNIVFKEVE
jgi:hypothetical protein